MAKGIYKRGNVYWIRYAGPDGRIVFESSGSTKFRDAEALLIKRRQAAKEGQLPDSRRAANYCFNELAEKYIDWMHGRHRSEDTKRYRIKGLLEYFGNPMLRQFNTQLVEQYQTELMRKGLKPASINKNIGILKAMFTKAVDWGMATETILKNIRKVKQLQENNRRLRYLEKEECQALIAACDSHLKPIVITALNTGMRRGEILSLKWHQIDFKNGLILLEMTKNGERRQVRMNQRVRDTLSGLIRRLDVEYVFFDKKTGQPFKEVKKSFSSAIKKAKLNDVRFHDLRHTFASHLVMSGVHITAVQELLGHKTLTMTLRYAHLAPSHMAEAVELLDRKLFSETPLRSSL